MASVFRDETATPEPTAHVTTRSVPSTRMKDGNRNTRSGGVGRTRATGDKSTKAVKTAQNDAIKARSERDAIFKAAQENEAVRSKEIQDLKAMLASITQQEVREQVEAQLDNMARQSREATVEIQGMRDEEGDTGMIDPGDQAEGSGEQEEPDDTTGVEDAAKNEWIAERLQKKLEQLPQPVNQSFYVDENNNLKAVDPLGADDVVPVAKQLIANGEGGVKVIRFLVRYGRQGRWLKPKETSFDESIVATLPRFPTPQHFEDEDRIKRPHEDRLVFSDLGNLSNVYYHGSPNLLCAEGLERDGRYPVTYLDFTNPDRKSVV